MPDQTVLITGSTGHVGFAVLVEALRKGYTVKAAVRSNDKADVVRPAALAKSNASESQLSFVVVPDITASGAFDEAVKGVDRIIHVASPVPKPGIEDFEKDMVQVAVNGTTSILYSALKEPQIKKVVITSSIGGVSAAEAKGQTYDANTVVDDPSGPYESLPKAYSAAKTKALNATRRFVQDKKPHFGVTNILPGFVLGRNELESSLEGIMNSSNGFALFAPTGKTIEDGFWFSVVALDDVAFLHVAALSTDPKFEGNFGASLAADAPHSWDQANEYAKKHFPEAVEKGILPANGHVKSVRTHFDTANTEKVFGFKFRGFEEQMKDILGYYVETVEKAKSGQK